MAADQPKPGQESGGVSYYLDSLTWGLGWAAALAALAGAVIELRRDLVRGLMLVAVPLALFVYLSVQSRYFGRWLLPAYPALAMLAAAAPASGLRSSVAAARRAGEASRRSLRRCSPALRCCSPSRSPPTSARRRCSAATTPASRRATGSSAHYPPELRASVEPAVPGRWFRSNPEGDPPPWLSRCAAARDGWTEPGWSYVGRATASACARSTSPASLPGRTAASAPRPTTPCSTRA